MNDLDSSGEQPKNTPFIRPTVFFIVGLAVGILIGSGRSLLNGKTSVGDAVSESGATFLTAPSSAHSPKPDIRGILLESQNTVGLERLRKLIEFAESIRPGQFEDTLGEILSNRQGAGGFDLIQSLFQKWAGMDAAAALSHAQALTGNDRKAALQGALPEWAAQQPLEALEWVETNDWNREFQSVLYVSLNTVANRNPEEAAALVESSPYLRNAATSIHVDGVFMEIPWFVYASWGETDLPAATQHALALREVSQRTNALNALARHTARRDPTAAWEWAGQLDREIDRQNAMEQVIRSLMSIDRTHEATAYFKTLPPGRTRSNVLSSLAVELSETNPREAFDFIEQHALGSQVGEAYHVIFRNWAKTDPQGAFETIIGRMGPGNEQKQALISLFAMVAFQDTARARELFAGLDPDQRRSVIHPVARAQAQEDPKAALAWAGKLEDPQSKRSALIAIFEEWPGIAPEEACANGLKLEEPDFRRQCLDSALLQWSNRDAAEAMIWAVQNLNDSLRESLIPETLLGAWADQDLHAAKDWVLGLPSGTLRDNCVSQLALKWSQYDAAATGEWLKELPPGEARDQAVQSFAWRVFDSDPEAALAWIGSIGNEAIRITLIENFAQNYLRTSPEKAKRWIANSTLPPEKQAELLKAAAQN